MAAVVLHFLGAEVESDGPQLLAECHRQRQTDITESDNCNCAHDPVSFVCNAAILAENLHLGGRRDIAAADPALPSRVPKIRGLMHIRRLHDIVIKSSGAAERS